MAEPDDYYDAIDELALDEDCCHFCGGDGWIDLDMDTIDDPVNGCDWASGGELGETVRCTCCGGSGRAEDCRWG